MRQSNAGDVKSHKNALKWYKLALQEDILIVNGTISESTFSNIITFGCRVKEIDWTLNFIETYIKYLPYSVRKEELYYSKAIVFFHQNDYVKSVFQLTRYSFTQRYILKTKLLLILSYFELYLNDLNPQLLNSSIVAYERYLQRNKMWTKKVKLPYANLCTVIKKIIIKKDKIESQQQIEKWYRGEIKKNYPIQGKAWILEQLTKKRNPESS